jgi:hypothetical protein
VSDSYISNFASVGLVSAVTAPPGPSTLNSVVVSNGAATSVVNVTIPASTAINVSVTENATGFTVSADVDLVNPTTVQLSFAPPIAPNSVTIFVIHQ